MLSDLVAASYWEIPGFLQAGRDTKSTTESSCRLNPNAPIVPERPFVGKCLVLASPKIYPANTTKGGVAIASLGKAKIAVTRVQITILFFARRNCLSPPPFDTGKTAT
jgi:hypothetical protein